MKYTYYHVHWVSLYPDTCFAKIRGDKGVFDTMRVLLDKGTPSVYDFIFNVYILSVNQTCRVL